MHISNMKRRVAMREPCRQMCQQCKPDDGWQQCGCQREVIFTQVAIHNQELTPQHIVLIMGMMIALLSCLCVLTVWYFGAVSTEAIRKHPPV